MVNIRDIRSSLSPMSIKSKLLLFLVPSMFLLFGILIFANLKITEKTVLEHIGHEAYYAALSLANEIDILTESSQKIAEGMAHTIEIAPKLEDSFIKKLLKANVEKNPGIYGSTISLSPGATRLGYYGPYYYRNTKGVKNKSLSSSYDYAKRDWFKVPMETGRGSWGEPYFDEGGGDILMVTYSTPIFRNGSNIGVATVDISLDNLVHNIQSVRVDMTGYAFLVSSKGYIIAHPDKGLLLRKIIT